MYYIKERKAFTPGIKLLKFAELLVPWSMMSINDRRDVSTGISVAREQDLKPSRRTTSKDPPTHRRISIHKCVCVGTVYIGTTRLSVNIA